MSNHTRETWSSKLGFMLASLGSAIGLGAMWKLPYAMGQNGGGAFILLFILFNFFVCLPLFIGELILGRESKKGTVASFLHFSKKDSSWAIVGWLIVLVVLMILGWYCVVAGWGICYIVLSLTDAFQGLSKEEISLSFDVFRQSGNLNLLFQFIFIALNVSVLLKGLSKGIEKWSKFMTSLLFFMLVALALYSMSLSGFDEAFHYLLYPDWSKMTPKGILSALGLSLFTLSLSYGAVMTYGSYLKKDEDIPKIATMVVSANIFASILIAIAIFPMIFTFGFAPQEGEGLIFKTLPFVFEQLPGSMIISLVFFVLLMFAALTSSIAMFEVVVTNLVDLEILNRRKAVFAAATTVFILGIPSALAKEGSIFSSWQDIFGTSFMATSIMLEDWLLVIIALLVTVFVAFIMPARAREQGFFGANKRNKFYRVWLFLLRTVVLLAISVVIAQRAQLINF